MPGPALNPEQEAEQKRREQERKLWQEYSNLDYMAYYRKLHGDYRWIKSDQKLMGGDQENNQPGLSSAVTALEMLKDGLYRKEANPPHKYEVSLKGGVATAVPVPDPKDFEKAYGAVLDLLASGKGARIVTIDWSDPAKVDLSNLKKLMLMADKRGLDVKIGGNALEALNRLNPEARDSYYAVLNKARERVQPQTGIEGDYHLQKGHIIKQAVKVLDEQKKMDAQYPSAAGRAAKDEMIDKLLAGKTVDEKITIISGEREQIQARISRLEQLREELKAHVDAMVHVINNDKLGPDVLEKAKAIFDGKSGETAANRDLLYAALEAETADLRARQQVWAEQLDAIKADPVTAPAQRDKVDVVLEGVKKLAVDLDKCGTELQKVKEQEKGAPGPDAEPSLDAKFNAVLEERKQAEMRP